LIKLNQQLINFKLISEYVKVQIQ